jgi:hypothetical protein
MIVVARRERKGDARRESLKEVDQPAKKANTYLPKLNKRS